MPSSNDERLRAAAKKREEELSAEEANAIAAAIHAAEEEEKAKERRTIRRGDGWVFVGDQQPYGHAYPPQRIPHGNGMLFNAEGAEVYSGWVMNSSPRCPIMHVQFC